MITTSNLEELLEVAHATIGKVLYAENCFIGLHDPATALVHFEFWMEQCDAVPAPMPITQAFTRSGYVLRTGRPLLLTRELEHELFRGAAMAHSGSPAASWLGVPLRTPARTIGVMAVQHYDKADAYTQRDLEFLASVGDQDCHMPELDGYEATTRIRARQGGHQPYIIAITANAMQGHNDFCLAVGMNGYVSKPVRTAELQAALEKRELAPRS